MSHDCKYESKMNEMSENIVLILQLVGGGHGDKGIIQRITALEGKDAMYTRIFVITGLICLAIGKFFL